MGEVVQLDSYRGYSSDTVAGKPSSSAYTSEMINAVSQNESFSKAAADSTDKTPVMPDRDSLIPIELAVGSKDRNYCLTRMAKYDVCAIHIRMVKDDPEALLYLMSVNDAIWLNKEMLEETDLSEAEVCQRIDLIQMLENVNGALMDSLWDSFTERSQSII